MLELKLRRIGSSLGVLIPKGEIEAVGLEEGDTVQIPRIARRGPKEMYGVWRENPIRLDYEET